MSLGYVGYARLVVEDDIYAIYEYSGENWNDMNSQDGDAILYDGELQINKSSLEEAEIHIKVKHMPGHRKRVETKRLVHFVDMYRKTHNGDFVILKECKNEFRPSLYCGNKYIADMIGKLIYEKYQETGELPAKIGFWQ